jgi:hypothetical protein
MKWVKWLIDWWIDFDPVYYEPLVKVTDRYCKGSQHEFPRYVTYNSVIGAKDTDFCQCRKYRAKEYFDLQISEMRELLYGKNEHTTKM